MSFPGVVVRAWITGCTLSVVFISFVTGAGNGNPNNYFALSTVAAAWGGILSSGIFMVNQWPIAFAAGASVIFAQKSENHIEIATFWAFFLFFSSQGSSSISFSDPSELFFGMVVGVAGVLSAPPLTKSLYGYFGQIIFLLLMQGNIPDSYLFTTRGAVLSFYISLVRMQRNSTISLSLLGAGIVDIFYIIARFASRKRFHESLVSATTSVNMGGLLTLTVLPFLSAHKTYPAGIDSLICSCSGFTSASLVYHEAQYSAFAPAVATAICLLNTHSRQVLDSLVDMIPLFFGILSFAVCFYLSMNATKEAERSLMASRKRRDVIQLEKRGKDQLEDSICKYLEIMFQSAYFSLSHSIHGGIAHLFSDRVNIRRIRRFKPIIRLSNPSSVPTDTPSLITTLLDFEIRLLGVFLEAKLFPVLHFSISDLRLDGRMSSLLSLPETISSGHFSNRGKKEAITKSLISSRDKCNLHIYQVRTLDYKLRVYIHFLIFWRVPSLIMFFIYLFTSRRTLNERVRNFIESRKLNARVDEEGTLMWECVMNESE